jgi:hypothetical protein
MLALKIKALLRYALIGFYAVGPGIPSKRFAVVADQEVVHCLRERSDAKLTVMPS